VRNSGLAMPSNWRQIVFEAFADRQHSRQGRHRLAMSRPASPSLQQAPLRSKQACAALLAACFVGLTRAPHQLGGTAAGDRSGDVLVDALLLGAGLAALAAAALLLAAWYCISQGSPTRRPWAAAEAGAAAVCVSGAALRLWCYRHLGSLFTYEVGIRQGHTLVATGPYAHLLHPSYTAAVMLAAGFLWFCDGPCGALRSWQWLALQAAVVAGVLGEHPCWLGDDNGGAGGPANRGISNLPTPLYSCSLVAMPVLLLPLRAAGAALRIPNEEQVLAEHFGEAWRQHAATRWRLVPLVY
jgi:protein-S-isoprenylcysteine O-methyltransferase Ste14